MNKSELKKRFICKDCGKNTMGSNKDYYMITNELWKKYGVGKGMLCMKCIEKRIGRKLTKIDILVCPLTTIINKYTSKILNI